MLFHAGALWRLNESAILYRIDHFSSVSGGSIIAGLLALRWQKLDFRNGVATNLVEQVVEPIRRLASSTIDVASIVEGLMTPGSISNRVMDAYRLHLFGNHTLQDLPDTPRFVFNATNVQSGVLWRFMKAYMRDYRVGEVKNPKVELAVAVAASSAFPPFLSPVRLRLDPSDFSPPSQGEELLGDEFRRDVFLTDGGVYDNLGLETAWKRYQTILASDAGGKMADVAFPKTDWARHSRRILDLVDNQVRALRKRQLLDSYRQGVRTGGYWGIRSDIADFNLPDALPAPHEQSMELANLETRLAATPASTQERLINWGYAVCDAAIRRHYDRSLPRPSGFPYAGGI